jgi:hypothetical protein
VHINYLITMCSHAEEQRRGAFRQARNQLIRLIDEWIAQP